MTANTYGRQVVLPLVNKSGGALAAGDVVIVDTSNNDAVTTTTSASSTTVVGIVQETIASNATGRVLLSGYAALVNVPSSVTRGHYAFTHTVAKQATGSASRAAGAFGQFLTGGTTPDAHIFGITDSSVTGLTDPMTTRGDTIIRNASNVTARLARGAANTFLHSDGTDVAYAAVLPADLDVSADNTTANATTGHHGLLPKLGGGTANFLRADGSWAAPAAGAVVLTGNVAADGTTTAGTGFSSAKTATGRYTITYTSAFGAAPVVLCQIFGSTGFAFIITSASTSSFGVETTNFGGSDTDKPFYFLAYTVA